MTGPKVGLYDYPTSICSQTARLALLEKGVPFERRNIDIMKKAEQFEPLDWRSTRNPLYRRLPLATKSLPIQFASSIGLRHSIFAKRFHLISRFLVFCHGVMLQPDLTPGTSSRYNTVCST